MKDANVIESVSAFVARTLAGRIDRDRGHRESDERLRRDFGPGDEDIALARQRHGRAGVHVPAGRAGAASRHGRQGRPGARRAR
ncbi:hypothetical protein I5Q34_01510 [Streptomyces sp. AV19]|uniref:hypothetical protein n=1 Tax=Streptomyces sp. AV19 TaxID=2793068 RepID=UPI0018FE2C32|nr:hypothetical protein [Streptomyces sp. AV19]MBH1932980.1 hypothetical protein [Streptomyces sp. AV19]MDG4533849.1 hypothetical protein [Streptomyces sp. AV19]